MNFQFKVGDVVQIKNSGYGFLTDDIGNWVEIIRFGTYGSGEQSAYVKAYEKNLTTKVGANGSYLCGVDSFGDNPAILLNTREEQKKVGEHGPASKPRHSHYFKDCCYDKVDVYRVLDLFHVVDPCIQHATKKLLVAGGRGHKDISRDIQDVIDTLERWKAMRAEEKLVEKI